jgi:oligopeptide/dipeptide ABC transporter ATP-binding protein
MTSDPLLEVRNLKTYFFLEKGIVKAVDGINFEMKSGEILGLVGESGCGKSVTALSIMRVVPYPGRIVEGSIIFEGIDILRLNEEEMRSLRGSKMAMIFQDPSTALNPTLTIGDQIAEVFQTHANMSKSEAYKVAKEMLDSVGIPSSQERLRDYPHQLSGGMKQRVMIAMALACKPKLLIADEPTTNLDVTIQAQILDLLKDLKNKFSTSILLITHNFGLVAEMCDSVAVMYAGKIVEYACVRDVLKNPKHPYTRGLLECIPDITKCVSNLPFIKGSLPDPTNMPLGCRFHPRCPYSFEECYNTEPELRRVSLNHYVACHLYGYGK